jgi:hypothetical protein
MDVHIHAKHIPLKPIEPFEFLPKLIVGARSFIANMLHPWAPSSCDPFFKVIIFFTSQWSKRLLRVTDGSLALKLHNLVFYEVGLEKRMVEILSTDELHDKWGIQRSLLIEKAIIYLLVNEIDQSSGSTSAVSPLQ